MYVSGDTPQIYTLIIVLYFYFYFALLTYLFDIVWLLPYFKLLSVNTLLISLLLEPPCYYSFLLFT